jgi:membrane-bound metal-dependent hydrolase YbcI (DUF457 family)
MDPLTHSLVGLTIAQTGPKRLSPHWPWITILAANLPDFDSIFLFAHDTRHLQWHRHFTHSLAAIPLMAFLCVAFFRFVLRLKIPWRGSLLLASLGVLSHDLVDWLTFRGSRIFLPFDDRIHSLKLVTMIDPVLLSLLALAFAIPFLSGLVAGEIGARRGSGRLTASLVLLACLSWLGCRYYSREMALSEVRSRVYEGAIPRRVEAIPTINPLAFDVLVECDDFYKELSLNLLEFYDPEEAQTWFKPKPSIEAGQALQAASQNQMLQVFLTWAHWPHWRVVSFGPNDSLPTDKQGRWVVIVRELAADRSQKPPQIILVLNDEYKILEEKYERPYD